MLDINNRLQFRSSNYHSMALIDFNLLHSNIDRIYEVAKAPIYPVIKADGYGHGMESIAVELASRGEVGAFAVWSIDEAIKLKATKIKKRIILLGGISSTNAKAIIDLGIEPVISSAIELSILKKKLGSQSCSVHFKLDSGMNRLGVRIEDAAKLYKQIARAKKIKIVALMTHFASADTDKDKTASQIKTFNEFRTAIRSMNLSVPISHASNSAGLLKYKDGIFDAVRPGLAIYGIQPFRGKDRGLSPILSLYAKVSHIKSIKKNETISYSERYRANKKMKVAVVTIGYGDGYFRLLSNRSRAIINDSYVKQVGTICMDVSTFDVSKASSVKIGDIVTVIGKSRTGLTVTATELASLAETIPYELLTRLGSRVIRRYSCFS